MLYTLLIFCALLPLVKSTESIRVSTKYGVIEGLVESYLNASGPFKSVSKFLGVPYAAPPTGDLKLRPPKPPVAWTPDILQATKYANACLQGNFLEFFTKMFASNFTYSDDCLYLNVFSPNVSLSLPVMVYIHGGSYEGGTALTFPGDILALHEVVVVVIQYRLGPFGFLTTGDSAAPGNFGMLDQVEALKWVKENIEHFGGNPNKVTIFGMSAGATSVNLHLLSPLSKGLFHQAIAESGVDLCPFAVQPVSFGLRFAKELAEKLDCTTSDHKAMVDCIRKKEGAEIQKASDLITYPYYDELRWAPVVDDNFLLDTPENLRKRENFKKVNLMVCFNSQEGGSYLEFMAALSFGIAESVADGASPSFFKEFVTKLAHARNNRKKNADLIAEALEFMYTPWPDRNDKYALRSQLIDLIGDYTFVAPIHEVADIHSKVAPVYMYEFAHRPKDVHIFSQSEWMGVAHGENAPFPFGIPLWYPGYDAADKNVSLFIMAVYTNFAKYGDPTPQPVSGVTWEKYNSSHSAYLRVDANPKMAAAFAPRRMSFWNDDYPKLEQVKFESKEVVISSSNAGVAMEMFYHFALVIVAMMF